jgi:ABC-type transport system involved in cytochrome c biogenesis permease subunit
VPVIMVSYSVLALAALIAHVQLIVAAAAPTRRSAIAAIDSLHYWYVHVGCILLGAGIVTGSMWAASSWGRYWGWDPKEVWSLVAFLAYLAILHRRVDREPTAGWVYAVGILLAAAVMMIVVSRLAPKSALGIGALGAAAALVFLCGFARGPFWMALKSVLAFWLIVMTYVGVNYVLGIGLHSYAFGTGAVAHYMFLVGGIDLALIALCAGVYLASLARSAAPLGP